MMYATRHRFLMLTSTFLSCKPSEYCVVLVTDSTIGGGGGGGDGGDGGDDKNLFILS